MNDTSDANFDVIVDLRGLCPRNNQYRKSKPKFWNLLFRKQLRTMG